MASSSDSEISRDSSPVEFDTRMTTRNKIPVGKSAVDDESLETDESSSSSTPGEDKGNSTGSSSDEGPNILNGFLGSVRVPVARGPTNPVKGTFQTPQKITKRKTLSADHPCACCSRVYTSKKRLENHLVKVHGALLVEDERMNKLDVERFSAPSKHGKPGDAIGNEDNGDDEESDKEPSSSSDDDGSPAAVASGNAHASLENTLPCPVCFKLYKSKYTLKNHLKDIHQAVPVEIKHSCDECRLIFKRKRDLQQHKKKEHAQEVQKRPKTSPRRLCEMRQKYTLTQQEKRANELAQLLPKQTFEERLSGSECDGWSKMPAAGKCIVSTDYMCSVCSFLAQSKFQLQTHFYQQHMKNMSCAEWMAAYVKSGAAVVLDGLTDVSVSSGSDVTPPKRSRLDAAGGSGGSSPYQDQMTRGPVVMRDPGNDEPGELPAPVRVSHRAVSSSTAAKSYTCLVCGFVCAYSSSWNMHMRKLHPERMNYHCNICAKGFFRESGLTTHLKRCRETVKAEC